jgi:phage shock protein A
MANKKISTDAIEKYKTKVTNLVTEIDDTYTSLKKITEKIDSISDECEIENLNIASHFSDSPSDDMEACLRGISTAFDNALKKAQDNDNKLKDKMMSRSTEINQLKGIISQYKAHVGSTAPMSSLAGTLSSIGRANFIDRIPGVVEGRQKRVELETKWNSAVLTDEQLLAKIKDSYRNLSDEDIKELMQYYRIMNTPQIVRGLASKGKQVVLLNENGKYRIAYLDWDIDYKESVMSGSTSADLDLPGTVNIDEDLSVGMNTNFGASLNASGNMYNGEYGDNTKINIGNVDASASIKTGEIGINAGGSLIDINHSFTTNEDDLYRYGIDVSIKVISGEISAKLSQEGFELGASNGLLGVNVSGGRTELIDINVDM